MLLLCAIVTHFTGVITGITASAEPRNSQLTPDLVIPERMRIFFRNFDHCLFRFHLGYSLNGSKGHDWVVYSKVLHFYSGLSPMTSQDLNITQFVKSLPKEQRKFPPFRKFMNCDVQLHMGQHLAIIWQTEDIYRKPEYLWFIFSHSDRKIDRKLTQDLNLLANIGYSTKYFAIFEFSSVKLICLSCAKKWGSVDLTGLSLNRRMGVNGLWYLETLWDKLHANLHWTPIKINVKLNKLRDMNRWSCNIHKSYVVDFSYCTYFTLSKKLNFTPIHRESHWLREIITHGSLYAQMIVTESNTDWITNRKFQMLSYGFGSEPYAFTMVMDYAPNNFQAIIQPFDWQTWTNLAILTVIVTKIILAYFHMAASTIRISPTTGVQMWFSVTGTLLDQPTGSVSKSIVKKKSLVILIWPLWNFVAVGLSQAYKGTFVSFLAATPSAWIPSSLSEILDTGMGMITQSGMNNFIDYRNGSGHTETTSILKDAVLRDILDNRPEANNSIYGELSRKLQWIGGNVASATVSMLKHQYINNTDTNESIQIPSNFFLIDKLWHAELFKTQLMFFTSKWTSRAQPLPVFLSRDGWTLKENYLYKKIADPLAKLYESGLYNRWASFYKKDDVLYYIRKAAIDHENITGVDPRDSLDFNFKGKQIGLSLKTLFLYVYMNEQKELAFVTNLPLKAYLMVMSYAVTCMIFSCAVFIVEIAILVVNKYL